MEVMADARGRPGLARAGEYCAKLGLGRDFFVNVGKFPTNVSLLSQTSRVRASSQPATYCPAPSVTKLSSHPHRSLTVAVNSSKAIVSEGVRDRCPSKLRRTPARQEWYSLVVQRHQERAMPELSQSYSLTKPP